MKRPCAALLAPILFLSGLKALAQQDDAKPMPPWSPIESGFTLRIEAVRKFLKEQNPDDDPRVLQRVRLVTATSGAKRDWVGKSAWTAGAVRFAVGKVADVQDPLQALDAAEKDAKGKLPGPASGQEDSRRPLDWVLDAEGTAYVLEGCWAPPATP